MRRDCLKASCAFAGERRLAQVGVGVKVAAVLALAFGVPGAPALATSTESARQPTRAEDSRLLPAARAYVPPAWRSKSWIRTRVSTLNPRWAAFKINPRAGYESVVQTAYGYARRTGVRWRVVAFGNSGVGCARVPGAVRSELMQAVRWDADEC